ALKGLASGATIAASEIPRVGRASRVAYAIDDERGYAFHPGKPAEPCLAALPANLPLDGGALLDRRKPMTEKSRLRFKIAGMDCADEVTILKRAVGPVVGGEDKLAFDILNAKMTVLAWDDLQPEDVVAAVGRT